MSSAQQMTLVEVGPRDGFQPIGPFITTARKIALIQHLYESGIRRMEVTAFVSNAALPQLADAAEVLQAAQSLPGLDAQVLVPNLRHAERALRAGATHLAFVISASEKHNRNNVRRSPRESIQDYAQIVALQSQSASVRLNVATAFDCPFDGPVDPATTLALLDDLVAVRPEAEICLCDTTGRVTPDRVHALMSAARVRFPRSHRWAFHGHDTYGLGLANVAAAWSAGIHVFDASFAGLGGCPFAPGATGNVSSEDLIWMFEHMGVATGIDIAKLVEAAREGAALPGALIGGRVRDAITAAARTHTA
jgi:hydroxymethylglutaryl-CoA lyase